MYPYDGLKKKNTVLNMIRNEIGDVEYLKLKNVIIDMIELLIDLSKRRIKLELNKKKWNCIS